MKEGEKKWWKVVVFVVMGRSFMGEYAWVSIAQRWSRIAPGLDRFSADIRSINHNKGKASRSSHFQSGERQKIWKGGT